MIRLLTFLLSATLLEAGAPPFRPTIEPGPSGWTAERGTLAMDASVSHSSGKSLRVEPGNSPDACIRSAPVSLRIGASYELSGWVRTDDVQVRDLDRSPIAIGAVLTMASMPFDVHSAALGGTRQWTHLALRFVASRTQDHILLTVGNGGAFNGKAWFSEVTLDETSAAGDPPAATVRTFGPAYRYPVGRLDLSAYRRPALRARLSARPSDGARDSGVSGALRRRSRRQGRRTRVGTRPAPP